MFFVTPCHVIKVYLNVMFDTSNDACNTHLQVGNRSYIVQIDKVISDPVLTVPESGYNFINIGDTS
jgi:hypothetical protein